MSQDTTKPFPYYLLLSAKTFPTTPLLKPDVNSQLISVVSVLEIHSEMSLQGTKRKWKIQKAPWQASSFYLILPLSFPNFRKNNHVPRENLTPGFLSR
jgi:hypothetical protein